MNTAILVKGEDWEGLYINNTLVQEGHTLNEGTSRIKYFVNLAKQYNFNLDELYEFYLSNEDEETTNTVGSFPKDITEFELLLKE